METLKAAYQWIKDWTESNGITGILGLILGVVFWTLGYKVFAGFAFGVFATRNWDILKEWFLKFTKKEE